MGVGGSERLESSAKERVAQRLQAEPLIDAKQAGALLGVPSSWVLSEARAGRLPCVPLGRYKRFRVSSLEAFVAGVEQGPSPYRVHRPGWEPEGSPHSNGGSAAGGTTRGLSGRP